MREKLIHTQNYFDLSQAESDDTSWLTSLSRAGWAWEFLRRNPDYRRQYAENPNLPVPAEWGLRYFVDPQKDSRTAAVYWRPDACTAVLPVIATPLNQGEVGLDLSRLSCSTELVPSEDGSSVDVLFHQEGRLLQLAVTGAQSLTNVRLSATVVPMPDHTAGRALAVRRFANLATSFSLQANLYPPERRAPRLTRLLVALDYWLMQRSYRDIGLRLYGDARITSEWNDPGNHLRDQVRRAVHYGRTLMDGGYRQFLR